MDLRELQRPLKQAYRADPTAALLTLQATASEQHSPMACSGDLLLGALAACAQVTYQMVSTAMGVPVASVHVEVEGDLDLRGTLGIDQATPVGFTAIRLAFDVDAPDATPEQLASVLEKTERYCVVLQTLTSPPIITVTGQRSMRWQ